MDAPETVTEAIEYLAGLGYTANMQLLDGEITWKSRGARCRVEEIEVDRVFRYEGPSDPGDEMIVFALTDPVSGDRGALASAYGSAADPELLEALTGLESRFARR
jgi:hypothetical protein